MLTTKFINLFLQLDRKEKQNLKLWVCSPFANAREDVQKLFDFVYSKRTITAENINRKLAFQFIYPFQPYKEQQLRYVMSFATVCLEEFMAYDEWKSNKEQHQLALINKMNHKNLSKFTAQEIQKVAQQLTRQKLRNSNFYLQSYQLANEQYTLQSKNKRFENFKLQEVSDYLHFYAISEILKHACVAISIQQVSGKQFAFYLVQNCIEVIEKESNFKKIPSVYLYYLCYQISTQGNDALFNELYAAIYKYENSFNESELKDIFLMAINYCIKEMNIGKNEYSKFAYELYLYALKKNYLLDNGELSRFTFKNIVFIGVKKLQDYKSVEHFITQFQHTINEQYRENTVLFNNATLYVAQKNYKPAMQILQTVEFEDVLWNLDAKSMLLRIYFEEKEYEAMLSLIKSFKLYLYRQYDLGIYKTRYKNMIGFCEKLYKNIGVLKVKKMKLKEDILQHKNLPEKDWFLIQVDKL